jgi:hypothetical protein
MYKGETRSRLDARSTHLCSDRTAGVCHMGVCAEQS